jgi:hypothetical protein
MPTCYILLDLAKSTNYEVPHYAIFSTLLLLPLSVAQTLFSAPCSQTPSLGVLSLGRETMSHTRRSADDTEYFKIRHITFSSFFTSYTLIVTFNLNRLYIRQI